MSRSLVPATALGLLCTALVGLAAAESASEAGGETFSQALRAAGWGVEVLADGTLQLTPAGLASAEPAPLADAPGPTAPAESQGQTQGASAPGGNSVDWSVLRNFGWRVERDAHQATLLFPPGSRAPTDSGPEPSPALGTSEVAAAPDLEDLLAVRGWRVEREADGTLVLAPLLAMAERAPSAARSLGQIPAAIAQGGLTLPIDTWEKARVVAASWLESVGDPGLRLGRIRRIHGVYLVSILGAQAPHPLRHQLSVAVDDGRVLVLK